MSTPQECRYEVARVVCGPFRDRPMILPPRKMPVDLYPTLEDVRASSARVCADLLERSQFKLAKTAYVRDLRTGRFV